MFLDTFTNGQPPNAIARKKVVGTTMTAYWDGIGPGGSTPSPTSSQEMRAKTSPAAAVAVSNTRPRAGCLSGANGGFVAMTAVTICGGISASITNDTQPTKSGKSKSDR